MFVFYLQLHHNIIMLNRKRTLPRHTVLAGQGSRIGAFLADFAMVGVAFLLLFLCFSKVIFANVTGPLQDEQLSEEYNAGLVIKVNDEYEKVTSDNYEDYINVLKYHFLSYMNGENLEEGKTAFRYAEAGKYTVEWFNKTILEIPDDPASSPNALFTLDGGDASKIGVPKEGAEIMEFY